MTKKDAKKKIKDKFERGKEEEVQFFEILRHFSLKKLRKFLKLRLDKIK